MPLQFAPLVFSRTKEVDFRFLAIPEDFSEGDMEWSQKHILATLLNSVELSENPRWSLFNNAQHYAIGLSCRANLLSERNIADKFNRGLYLFVGYVAKNPALVPMQTDIFKSLYKFVHQKWEDDSIDARKLIKVNYEISLPTLAKEMQNDTRLDINKDVDQVFVYPNSRNQELWAAFSQYAEPVSLCLNVAGQKDAKEGIFLNVSSTDCRSETPLKISRIPPRPQPIPQTDPPKSGPSEVNSPRKPSGPESRNSVSDSSKPIIEEIFDFLTSFSPFKGESEKKQNPPMGQNKNESVKTHTSLNKPSSENKQTKPPFGGRFLDDDKKK